MAKLTIKNIDTATMKRLRARAALKGHSMEAEARIILTQAVSSVTGPELWKRSRELFGGADGVDLQLSALPPERPVPDFGEDGFH